MRPYSAQTTHKRHLFLAVFVIISMISAAGWLAFNGGFSMQAAGVEITLDASPSGGLQVSFVSA